MSVAATVVGKRSGSISSPPLLAVVLALEWTLLRVRLVISLEGDGSHCLVRTDVFT